jgi:uncharacterized protein (DUF1697 family)
MPVYVSLLRAVNVGGRNAVSMSALREIYASIGHRDVTTYVQSGNVVSRSTVRSARQVAVDAARALREEVGVETDVLVRTVPELSRILAGWPFRDPPGSAAPVTFLANRPSAPLPDLARFLPDEAVLVGREVHLHVPSGYGHTKLDNAFLERSLHVAATTRNWRTVTELVRIAGA